MEMERLNFGLRISEQFDWIVGTSIGGVIALLLVYSTYVHELVSELAANSAFEVQNAVRFVQSRESVQEKRDKP